MYIGDETDPLAIFFLFVALVAGGICCLVCQIKPSLPVQPQQRVEVVFREHQQPKQPKPIPINSKKIRRNYHD